MQDVVAEMGPAFLASRLKRLGERMQASSATVISDAGLPLLPGQMAIMAALRTGPMSVGDLAEACGSSQPGVTRVLNQLDKLGMIAEVDRPDQRSRVVELSKTGRSAAAVLTTDVWPRVGMAAREVVAFADTDFLQQLGRIEAALAERSIAQRAAKPAPAGLRVREFDESLSADFHDINVEWIKAMFALEPADREVLENPQKEIIEPGGSILFVEAPGLGIVGTCALKKTGPGAYELTKMGVRETARGLKAGEFLLQAVIERAKELGATKLYLLTNRKCEAAIHLYEKLGFEHDAGIMDDYAARYRRCDVAMLYTGG